MLFLMGLHHVVSAVFAGDSRFFLVRQMTHVAWQGFSQRDLVFPLFLFIAGLSLPFSLAAQRARGRTTRAIVCGIVRRGLVLTCLGLLCSGVLSKPLDEVVWGTVLGQIGFAWGVAALLSLATGWRARAGVVGFLLVAYTVVLRTCVAPDHPDLSSFSMDGNIAGWIDRQVFPNAAGHYYAQGILAHVSAVATALLGVLTGEFVRSRRLDGDRTSLALAVAGVVLAAAGFAADAVGLVPVVKKMWTPSFVLVAGGWSVFLFALLHWLVDVRGIWTRTTAFRAVGMNAITIYLIVSFFDFWALAKNFTGFAYRCLPAYFGDVLSAAVELAIAWGLLVFLFRKKVFLKV